MKYKTKKTDNKKESLTARCTNDEKNKITRKAEALNKSTSEYILDCCMAGTERKSSKLKKLLVKEIQITEQLNQIHYLIAKNEASLPEAFKEELSKELEKLGGINQCQC